MRHQRILIVDDEPLARERLRSLLATLPGTTLAGEAAAGDEAVVKAQALRPDVVLLDVRMPGMNGLEAARHMALLDNPPAIIFTTAYDAYALEAFEAAAVGYLLKPVRSEKLAAALERAARFGQAQWEQIAGPQAPQPDARTHIAIKVREGMRLVPLRDIYCFIADQKYTTVRHTGGSDLIEDSLRALELEFPAQFVRVHRNALVNAQRIAAIERSAEGQYAVVLQDLDEQIPVSRRLAGELRERFRL
ncbi:MAG TPA: LytTR family DNA-binding domain-containing protein [Steroidobacteraceae bacterium]|nr:LytTR family DNA-binding domain-containing protein [Steroidobacteraceae bacterium]